MLLYLGPAVCVAAVIGAAVAELDAGVLSTFDNPQGGGWIIAGLIACLGTITLGLLRGVGRTVSPKISGTHAAVFFALLAALCGGSGFASYRSSLAGYDTQLAAIATVRVRDTVFEAPGVWVPTSEDETWRMKQQVEAGAQSMLADFAKTPAARVAIGDFYSARLWRGEGQLVAYAVEVDAKGRDDYLSVVSADQQAKLDWGLEQGIVKEIISIEDGTGGAKDRIQIHLVSRDDSHMFALYHWSPDDPGWMIAVNLLIGADEGPAEGARTEALLASFRRTGL